MSGAPGGGWLSAHLFFDGWIYAPDGDRVVLDVVRPFVRRCRDQGWIGRHFFIRYADSGPHLRLRLHGAADVLEAEVWPALVEHVRAHSPGVEAGELPENLEGPHCAEGEPVRVTHLARVPYEPETGRYGGPDALVVSERAFEVSSEAAYALLARLPPERPARLGKGLLAMIVAVRLFAAGREEGASFAQVYSTSYLQAVAREEGGREALLDAFGAGYGGQAERLVEYVDAVWEAIGAGESLSPALDAYAAGMRDVRDELRALFEQGRVRVAGAAARTWTRAWQALVPSYLHMTSNRLGITVQEESYLGYLITRALETSRTRSPQG